MTAPVPIGGSPHIAPANAPGAAPGVKTGSKDGGDFLKVFKDMINSANNQQLSANKAVEGLVNGKDNIQEVVTSMAKADLSFRFIIEVRNRLIESYQELMRMQV